MVFFGMLSIKMENVIRKWSMENSYLYYNNRLIEK
jgi:hypothetical protein